MSMRRLSTANELLYPMCVLPCRSFLDVDVWAQFGGIVPCHQQLLQAGLLVTWEPHLHLGPVAFISHQWMGIEHADKNFSQLAVLRTFMQRIRDGKITRILRDWLIELAYKDSKFARVLEEDELQEWITDGFLWYDYFSIPQTVGYDLDPGPALMNAVNSIPAYIEHCDHFVVLCPPLEHETNLDEVGKPAIVDYASWSHRGWCRAETAVRMLARNSGPLIKVDSAAGTPVILTPFETWHCLPGDGMYSCCERDHRFPRTGPDGSVDMVHVECDKIKIAAIMHSLVDAKVQTLLSELDCAQRRGADDASAADKALGELRWILAIRKHMLSGLERYSIDGHNDTSTRRPEASDTPAEACRAFLGEFHFDVATVDGSTEDHRSGLTPLRYAVISNNLAAAKELIRRGADVEAPLAKDCHEKGGIAGRTALFDAAQYGTVEMVQLLLEHGVNGAAVDRTSMTAANFACYGEKVEILKELLGRVPALIRKRGDFGHTILMTALVSQQGRRAGACAMELLDRGVRAEEADLQGAGYNTLMEACLARRGHGRVIRWLLQHPNCAIDVNAQTRLRDNSVFLLVVALCARLQLWLDSVVLRRQSSSVVEELAPLALSGATALMVAARRGSVPFARALLDAKADPGLKDARGRTARDLAASKGYDLMEKVLLEAEREWAVSPGRDVLAGIS